MKKLTSILTAVIAVIVLTVSVQKSFAADNLQVTDLTNVKNITSIKVSGNVEVQLSQATSENVLVYNQYYSENALVQVQNGELRISSFGAEKLKVLVDVKMLNHIEASGNAVISTLNQLTAPNLSVSLEDSAVAVINTSAAAVKSFTEDSASLTLSGTAKIHSMQISETGKTDTTHFRADSDTVKISGDGQAVTNVQGKTVILKAPEDILSVQL